MGQKVIGHKVASGDVIDMGPDESVLILIKHCRDMKKQETCLRFITLLLLLTCVALFIVGLNVELRQRENSGSSGHGSALQQNPAYSMQERMCSKDDPETNPKTLHINLSFEPIDDTNFDKQPIEWDFIFGDEQQFNKEKSAIVIPETGIYFVYVRIALTCSTKEGYEHFSVKLQKWNEAYDKIVDLTDAFDGIMCNSAHVVSNNVFVGDLFELLAGDHVSVLIELGSEVVRKLSFGAYLT